MKLHWSPRSPFVRKVMIAAHELNLTDRIECVRNVVALARPNREVMADNPLNKIPTLVLEDGTALFDSRVVVEYLDSLGGGRLVPPAGPARWAALSRQALGDGLLDLLILWRNERDKPEERQTAAWLDAFAAKCTATLDRLDALASELGRDPFGAGHIAIGCALAYLDFRFADIAWRTGRAGLAHWHATFNLRPSVQATEPVDD